MVRTIKRVILWGLLLVVALITLTVAFNWSLVQRLFLGGLHVYETQPPALPAEIRRPAILVFSKTNAFRHDAAIAAADGLFAGFAKKQGWGYFQTENGATFSPAILTRFDVVVFNNVSGDVFTPAQRDAFKTWLEQGGGYVGIHAAGDISHAAWRWYMTDVIGTNFTQHTLWPHIQTATVHVEDAKHPVAQGLPATWRWTEEWYSFDKSPRRKGYGILVSVDENTYKPAGLFGKDLRMGDHPMVWWHCVGKGRVIYSAFGHDPESFSQPVYERLLTNAVTWAAHRAGDECGGSPMTGPATGTMEKTQ